MTASRNSLLPWHKFFVHIARNFTLALLMVAVALYIGMLGYHFFERMNWIDAFVNASMILCGMGPVQPLNTDAGKLFAGCYALFSGLAFILIMGIVFAPIVHRFFKTIHIEMSDDALPKHHVPNQES